MRIRLFLPLLALLLVLPVIAWKIASKSSDAGNWMKRGKVYHSAPGPWGDLEYVSIAIEIPDHFVDVEQIDGAEWIFSDHSREQVVEFFKSCDLTSAQLDSLLTKAKWDVGSDGCRVSPDDDLIWSLNPETRQKIYFLLAQSPENVEQFYAFSYRPERLTERLELSGLQKSTIELFKSLLYPQGSIIRFADTDIVLRKLTDRNERLRFVKTVSRRSSLLVKLNVNPKSDIDKLLGYWGDGGRAKDLRPLLESLGRVTGGCKIDVAHLLPPFARQRIYTYPQPTERTSAGTEDCHWTSLNFFNDSPTSPFSAPDEVAKLLQAGYAKVGEDVTRARFGDVVCLKISEDIIVHSAVYIADDIVFTKNGAGLNQPWIYMKMEDMLPHYMMPNMPLKTVIYRRKQI